MFKKIASLLFKEEEIIIEEEIEDKEDDLNIPQLKPLTPKKPVTDNLQTGNVSEPVRTYTPKPVQEIEKVEINIEPEESAKPRKTVMITADDNLALESQPKNSKEKDSKNKFERRQSTYQPKDIISPIYGGPTSSTEPLKSSVSTEAKKKKPVTSVISPMYGAVQIEEETVEIDESLLNLDVSEMISEERNQEEVQVSLYDYLEGFENEEE